MSLVVLLGLRRHQREHAISKEGLQDRGDNLRLREEVCKLMGIGQPPDVNALLLHQVLSHQHIQERLALRRE